MLTLLTKYADVNSRLNKDWSISYTNKTLVISYLLLLFWSNPINSVNLLGYYDQVYNYFVGNFLGLNYPRYNNVIGGTAYNLLTSMNDKLYAGKILFNIFFGFIVLTFYTLGNFVRLLILHLKIFYYLARNRDEEVERFIESH